MMNALMTRMMVAVATAQATTGNVDLSNVTSPIIGLVNSILNAAIPLVAAVGALYCVLLGVKYAKAEEPQDREKAKQHLKSAIIGFVLIFVLVVALRIATPILTDWMNANS
jgi:heme/copper-type cytochrome/quinol oxidase subunit 4